VLWAQFALLGSSLPAAAKASFVFVAAVALSWGACVAFARAFTPPRPAPTASIGHLATGPRG
jgi:hypothetical protein